MKHTKLLLVGLVILVVLSAFWLFGVFSIVKGLVICSPGNFNDGGKCYRDIAMADNVESLCRFSKANWDECFGTIAASKNNINICDSAGDAKQACIVQFAIVKRDAQICDKAIGYIEGSNVAYRDFCIHHIATVAKDNNLCDNISSNEIKNSCYNLINRTT